jgi:hypothetical protein
MKHFIRITDPATRAHAYLSHKGKASFHPATARKYWREYLAAHPGASARIEDQFQDPVQTVRSASRLEGIARRPVEFPTEDVNLAAPNQQARGFVLRPSLP